MIWLFSNATKTNCVNITNVRQQQNETTATKNTTKSNGQIASHGKVLDKVQAFTYLGGIAGIAE